MVENLALIQRRLEKSVFPVGGGAFQDMWHRCGRGTLGFAEQKPPASQIDHAHIAGVVPVEIANRFVPPLLTLGPMRRSDYLTMFASVEAELPKGVAATARSFALATVDDAVRQGLGCRWVEQVMLHAVIAGMQKTPEFPPAAKQGFPLTSGEEPQIR